MYVILINYCAVFMTLSKIEFVNDRFDSCNISKPSSTHYFRCQTESFVCLVTCTVFYEGETCSVSCQFYNLWNISTIIVFQVFFDNKWKVSVLFTNVYYDIKPWHPASFTELTSYALVYVVNLHISKEHYKPSRCILKFPNILGTHS